MKSGKIKLYRNSIHIRVGGEEVITMDYQLSPDEGGAIERGKEIVERGTYRGYSVVATQVVHAFAQIPKNIEFCEWEWRSDAWYSRCAMKRRIDPDYTLFKDDCELNHCPKCGKTIDVQSIWIPVERFKGLVGKDVHVTSLCKVTGGVDLANTTISTPVKIEDAICASRNNDDIIMYVTDVLCQTSDGISKPPYFDLPFTKPSRW